MTLLGETRAAISLAAARAVLGALALTGDPAARLIRVRPPADPYPDYDRVRAHGPLRPSRLGIQVTASHAVCNAVLRDPRFGVVPAEAFNMDWSAGAANRETLAHPIEHSLLSMNPPEHTRLRRITAPWFAPKTLRARNERIERVVEECLDEVAGRREFDLIAEFAVRVPVRVICELFAITDPDHAKLVAWGSALANTLDGARTMAERRAVRTSVTELGDFFDDLVAQRAVAPGDDLLSLLITARPDGEPLTRRDIVATAGLLLGAGFETTVNLIGNGVHALLERPAVAQRLIDEPQCAGDVVEEVLRFDAPVQSTVRIAHEPVTVAGRDLPRGTVIMPLLGGANRDPEVFGAPNEFDPARPNNREHLAFSAGAHFCLGAGLARAEGEVALRALFARFPGLRRGGPVRRRRSRIIRGLSRLPVRTG